MTKVKYNDPLWEHFIPVWTNLEKLGCNACLIGGYALALKQRWLLESKNPPTLIDREQWPISRVTQDLDVVFPIRVIGDPQKNPGIESALTGLGWGPHREHGNWTYIKVINGFSEPIKFELHTPTPPPDGVSVQVRGMRVKPKPKPTGSKTVHGTPNPEAIGFDSFPMEFDCPSPDTSSFSRVRIPHPLSLCMMKLISAADRYKKSQNPQSVPAKRELQLFQARKHAGDVGRTIAMLLKEETNSMNKVRELIHHTAPFQKACKISHEDFISTDGWAHLFLRQPQQWNEDNLNRIIEVLSEWFPA
ncbi:MAG: hypothetical protein WAX69_26990 [Victivallales bacterium]